MRDRENPSRHPRPEKAPPLKNAGRQRGLDDFPLGEPALVYPEVVQSLDLLVVLPQSSGS